MSYQLSRICILIVEDNQPMLDITKSLLLTFGVGNVVTAKNGNNGFKKFMEHDPDIIIADWMMKPMDGITFTQQVRNHPNSVNSFVPVILMTGFSEKRRVLEARDAGVTEFLVKPFNARDLYKRIAQVIERPRQFVRAPDFFGPDRRRHRDEEFQGPFRREEDLKNPDVLKKLQERKEKAHKALKEIRDQAGLDKGDKFDLSPEDIDFR
jgi:DNA-binding response OmpR family regulator